MPAVEKPPISEAIQVTQNAVSQGSDLLIDCNSFLYCYVRVIQPDSGLAHYEVVSALGKGGMGEVRRARDTKLGRDVAIKTLPEEFAKDADRLARFEREAKPLVSLNHSKTAAIYGPEQSDCGDGSRSSLEGPC